MLTSLGELTGQSSSVKSGEIFHVNTLRELCSDHVKDATEKVSRATGVSSNGDFWVLHALDTIRKLESMPKNVHIAFSIGDEDVSEDKPIDKAQEALAKLKAVCQILVMDVI